ncbi:MAG: hypothetical protein ACXABY_19970 [Candidatus Thorarchaeota archaeon]|jgi:hypothetical protein
MTREEFLKLKVGDRVKFAPGAVGAGSRSDTGEVRQVNFEDGEQYIVIIWDGDGYTTSEWEDSVSDIFSYGPKDFPHICPYCHKPAMVETEALYCSDNCEGSNNEAGQL